MQPRPAGAARLSRRSMLAGALGAAASTALAACSSGGQKSTATSLLHLNPENGKPSPSDLVLLQIFPNDAPYAFAGAPQRLNFALGNSEGAFLDTGPSVLRFSVTDASRKPVGSPIDVALHDADLQKGYYPLVFDPPAPGVYTATARAGRQTLTASFQVWDKSKVQVPGPGDRMPPVATPTTADHQGVEPICTAQPPCPLHAVSLDAALARHEPVAFLIATPAYCQTDVCGPVLDVLLKARTDYGNRVTMIHNEVYRSGAEAAKGRRSEANLTPALAALHLSFEPSLVLVRRDGTIYERLDTVFDSSELRAGLDALVR